MRIRFSLRSEVAASFFAAFLVLVAIGVASYESFSGLLKTQEWVTHTQEDLHLLNRLLSEIEIAGSEQRLYLITGQERYIDSYSKYRQRALTSLKRINALLAPPDIGQQQITMLEPFIIERFKIADLLIKIREKDGFLAAQKIIKTGRTDGITKLIRDYIEKIKGEQRKRLAVRVAIARKSAEKMSSAITAAIAAALIFLSLAAWIIYQDLNERLRLEDERARFFRVSVDLFCVVNFDGFFEQVNPAWEKTLGYSPAEIISRPILDLFHPDDRAAAMREIERLTLGFTITDFEARALCKDGGSRYLRWNAVASLPERVIYSSARDITEQKRLIRMKDEVIAMATHEMRNPLTAIHASLSVLMEEVKQSLSPTAEKLLSIAYQSSSHLIELVNDFLDIQKLEYGRMEFHFHPLPLEPLLRKAVDLNSAYAQKNGVSFHIRGFIPPVTVNVDEGRFLQVMGNLMTNAVKYSSQGQPIQIASNQWDDFVRISVIDSGRGIPEEFQSRVFEKFAQAEGSKQGTGLGLSISKAIVEKMGGNIGFNTHPGRGTEFFFDLPILPKSDPSKETSSATA